MREDAADSIYYALPFFNIRRLQFPIALELVQELANPMTDERTILAALQVVWEKFNAGEGGKSKQSDQACFFKLLKTRSLIRKAFCRAFCSTEGRSGINPRL